MISEIFVKNLPKEDLDECGSPSTWGDATSTLWSKVEIAGHDYRILRLTSPGRRKAKYHGCIRSMANFVKP